MCRMDYNKIYSKIVERGKNRIIEGYTERHHIIPRCMGGDNQPDNLVELTAREHFLCHMLLCEIYPKNYKLLHALFLMSIGKQKVKAQQYVIGSRTYERLRLEYSNMLTGRPQSEETKLKKSISMKQAWASKSTEEMSKIGDKRWETRIQNGTNIVTEQQKENISKALMGRKMPWRTKPVSQLTIDGDWVKDWESVAQIERQLGSGPGECVRGKQKTSRGYVWKHKK